MADIRDTCPVPGQAGEMGQQEPFSAEGNAEGLTQERRKPTNLARMGANWLESRFARKTTGLVGHQVEHEPVMCP